MSERYMHYSISHEFFIYFFMIRVVLRKEKRICILVIRCKILDAITEFLSFISGGLKKPHPNLVQMEYGNYYLRKSNLSQDQ